MKKEELEDIIYRININTASDEDLRKYHVWCQSLQEKGENITNFSSIQPRLFKQISKDINGAVKVKFISFYRIVAAASILLFISAGMYLLLNKSRNNYKIGITQIHDINPGSDKAVLVLSNGKRIDLTAAKSGSITQQQGVNVIKLASGQLSYIINTVASNEKETVYNKIETPAGGQFKINLADGTKVWLNSKSSIRFPTAFTGNNRTVEVTGEAYFEVVHNNLKPFRVMVKGQTIEDIGTQFNINAYDDEPEIKTTLLEGGIRISGNGQTAILKPGQQAQTALNEKTKIFDNADIEESIAWKNGLFKFSHADIKTVMRQFSRWYNVDIAYEGVIPDDGISGEIYRNVNISQALEIVKDLNIHYRIENIKGINKITIAP